MKNEPDEDDRLYTYAEVADKLRVSVNGVRLAVSRGEIRPVYFGRVPRVRKAELKRYMDSMPAQPVAAS